MSARKQESIWTSFSRQQQKLSTLHPKRLSTEEDDADDVPPDAKARSVENLSVVVKKRKRTATNGRVEGPDEGDAGTVTDGELFSSQEDLFERRSTDFNVCVAPTGTVRGGPVSNGEASAASEDDQESAKRWSDAAETDVRLSQHLVTPEKPGMRVKPHDAAAMFSPRTAKLSLHDQKEVGGRFFSQFA